MKRIIALLLGICLCLSLAACGGKEPEKDADGGTSLAQDDYAYLDGLWYMEGDMAKATLRFVAQDNGGLWESRDETGEALASGRFTIVEKNEIKLYDAAGEYQLSLFLQDENTVTMGESGTEYVRGSSLEGFNGDDVSLPVEPEEDDVSLPVEPEYDYTTLVGEWYNDVEESTLIFDGDGGFQLSDGANTVYGSYAFDGTSVSLETDADTLAGYVDSEGDILFDNVDGYFTRSDYQEPQEPEYTSSVVIKDNGDGTQSVTDSALGVTCTCPTWMEAPDLLSDALTISDGSNGFVVGRNIDDYYAGYTGSDEDFINEYINNYVYYDFGSIYGMASDYADYNILGDEGTASRIETAEINYFNEDFDIYIKCLIYRTTGGVVMAKTFFVPYGESDQFDILWKQVKNLVSA